MRTKRILSSYSPESQSWKYKTDNRLSEATFVFQSTFVMILIPLSFHTLFLGMVPTLFLSARQATTKVACRDISNWPEITPCSAWSYTPKPRLKALACLFGVPTRTEISSSYSPSRSPRRKMKRKSSGSFMVASSASHSDTSHRERW